MVFIPVFFATCSAGLFCAGFLATDGIGSAITLLFAGLNVLATLVSAYAALVVAERGKKRAKKNRRNHNHSRRTSKSSDFRRPGLPDTYSKQSTDTT